MALSVTTRRRLAHIMGEISDLRLDLRVEAEELPKRHIDAPQYAAVLSHLETALEATAQAKKAARI